MAVFPKIISQFDAIETCNILKGQMPTLENDNIYGSYEYIKHEYNMVKHNPSCLTTREKMSPLL